MNYGAVVEDKNEIKNTDCQDSGTMTTTTTTTIDDDDVEKYYNAVIRSETNIEGEFEYKSVCHSPRDYISGIFQGTKRPP